METGTEAEVVYRYIVDYTASNGYSPTYREIAVAIEVTSTATVSEYLEVLRAQGRVTWVPNKARTIRIT